MCACLTVDMEQLDSTERFFREFCIVEFFEKAIDQTFG
jgi:hypothetical protein